MRKLVKHTMGLRCTRPDRPGRSPLPNPLLVRMMCVLAGMAAMTVVLLVVDVIKAVIVTTRSTPSSHLRLDHHRVDMHAGSHGRGDRGNLLDVYQAQRCTSPGRLGAEANTGRTQPQP